MGLLDDWLDTFESVLTGPTDYFRSEERRDGFGYSLKFAIVSLVIAAVFNAARAGFVGPTQLSQVLPLGSSALIALGVLVVSPIIGVLGLLISSALVHIFVALFGGEAGYSETLSAFEYATAISPLTALMSLVPVLGGLVNLVLGIYGIYIQVKALENFQGLSTWKALGAVILPGVILIGLVVAAAVVFAFNAPSLATVQ
jgi:hypothetical protein